MTRSSVLICRKHGIELDGLRWCDICNTVADPVRRVYDTETNKYTYEEV